MRTPRTAWLWVPILNACTVSASVPLVDGICDDYSSDRRISFSEGVGLHTYQDDRFVWLCVSLPEGSYGVTDLELRTDALRHPVNLHASAQLGEWRADLDETAPQSPDSPEWWNNTGWTANPMRFHGLRPPNASGEVRPRFLPSEGREYQLAKSRFGSGAWHMRLTVSGVAGPDGRFRSVAFPRDADDPDLVLVVSR